MAEDGKMDIEEAEQSESITDFVKEFLDSKTWTTLIMTATFYALFQADLCIMYFSKKADPVVGYLALGWFVVFMFEMCLNFALGIDYGAKSGCQKFTFYFVLDLVGTLSLIPDFLIIFDIEMAAAGSLTMARAARTARIGARLTRLMKLFRSKGGNSAYSQMMLGDEQAAMEESAASKFGEAVSDGISQKVVMLTLTLLIIVPFFIPAVVPAKAEAIDIIEAVDNDHLLKAFAHNDGPITYFQNFEDAQLVHLELLDDPDFTAPTSAGSRAGARCNTYRAPTTCGMNMEGGRILSTIAGWCDGNLNVANNNFQYCKEDGAAVACPVACGTIRQNLVDWTDKEMMREDELKYFSPTADTTERLSTRLKATFYYRDLKVHDAWLTVMYMLFNIVIFGLSTGVFLNEIFELVINPIERICGALQALGKSMKTLQSEREDEDEDEFERLGNSILSLTDMLKSSLGAAGTAIIKNNIEGDQTTVNALVPGVMMNGYFGFCDVRKFDEVLKVLQTDSMVLTNTISAIVHHHVAEHMGAPNKNMGDSWLSVWTSKDEATYHNADGMTFSDHALMAFVEINEEVQKHAGLLDLGKRPGFKASYPKGYVPDMGFGLHYGWAVEGAVGSERKVDATYLSPHVNMAARLEQATKQYDCSILVSEEMYNRMSETYQRHLRAVDRVMVVGSTWPMKLYAYDEGPDENNSVLSKKNRFSTEFDQAVDKYISGEWKDAKKLLFSCLGARNGDIAATKLIDYMAETGRGDNSPDSWQGYRELTSK
jgi:class 3 adenylate cyclase